MLVVLGAAALTDLLAVVAEIRAYARLDGGLGLLPSSAAGLEATDRFYEFATDLRYPVWVVCGIVFVVWFFRTRRSTGLLAPDRFRRGPGWAIGGWIVPIGNFYLPYGIAVDMWRAVTPPPAEGQRRSASKWPVGVWWALFLASELIDQVASSAYGSATSRPSLLSAIEVQLVSCTVDFVAAGAAAYFVVRLSTMQRESAAANRFWGAQVR